MITTSSYGLVGNDLKDLYEMLEEGFLIIGFGSKLNSVEGEVEEKRMLK